MRTTDGLPRVFFDWIELEGPLYEQWPPKSTEILFPDGIKKDDDLAYAKRIFYSFVPKAFRRPALPGEVEGILKVVEAEMKDGMAFVDAIRSGLIATLCSPSFLYLFESSSPADKGAARLLNDWEIASRLSYFLWSSMPDDELFDLAKKGKLRGSSDDRITG